MAQNASPDLYTGIFTIDRIQPSETFIRAQASRLPGRVEVVEGRPTLDGRDLLPTARARKWRALLARAVGREPRDYFGELSDAYVRIIARRRFDVVLAQYGPGGVMVSKGCRRAGTPLVVHFHGYDATRKDVIDHWRRDYERLFDQAAAIVVVSRRMEGDLVALGAPRDKIRLNPCGIDPERFRGSNPEQVPPVFLAVGRFVAKKSPESTIRAFAAVRAGHPDARLRMIGDGELRPACEELARELGVADAVDFLGVRGHEDVQEEMRRARCLVQHSVTAENGDMEGTPVAVLEAGASGLPVVSTRHAGILDAVVEGETGLLVDEHDVEGMAARMGELAADPDYAGRLGRAARERMAREYSIDGHIARLAAILAEAARGRA